MTAPKIYKPHKNYEEGMRSKILTCHKPLGILNRSLSNGKGQGAISGTVCGWHVGILLRITVARGLAPDRLNGFSIGRYEKNRESFDLYAAKFESGAMRFLG